MFHPLKKDKQELRVLDYARPQEGRQLPRRTITLVYVTLLVLAIMLALAFLGTGLMGDGRRDYTMLAIAGSLAPTSVILAGLTIIELFRQH